MKIIVVTEFPDEGTVRVLAENLATKQMFHDEAVPRDQIGKKVEELIKNL